VSLTAPYWEKVEVIAIITPVVQGEVNHLGGSMVEDIKVVCEYPDVFPNDLPGMPPKREIEFVIELLPSCYMALHPYLRDPIG